MYSDIKLEIRIVFCGFLILLSFLTSQRSIPQARHITVLWPQIAPRRRTNYHGGHVRSD